MVRHVVVRRGPSLLGRMVGTAVVGGLAYKAGQARAYEQAAVQQQAAAPAPLSTEDKYAKIEQLNKLKQSGALTEEEFQREKQKILTSLA